MVQHTCKSWSSKQNQPVRAGSACSCRISLFVQDQPVRTGSACSCRISLFVQDQPVRAGSTCLYSLQRSSFKWHCCRCWNVTATLALSVISAVPSYNALTSSLEIMFWNHNARRIEKWIKKFVSFLKTRLRCRNVVWVTSSVWHHTHGAPYDVILSS